MSKRPTHFCDFCNKSQYVVKEIVAAPGGAAICDECIDVCKELIDAERSKSSPEASGGGNAV